MTHDELEPIMATLGFYQPSVLQWQHLFPFGIPHAIHCSRCFLNFARFDAGGNCRMKLLKSTILVLLLLSYKTPVLGAN